MSSKPPPRGDRPDRQHRPEPPNLHSDLAERPEVKALLAELTKDLKPGEDPLFYKLPEEPEEPPDPDAKGPDAAQVYVAPTAARPVVKHKTLDMHKVRVAAAADPRRAVTRRIEREVPAPEKTAPEKERSSHPPPVTPPSTAKVVSGSRRRVGWMIGVAMVAVVVLGAAVVRRGRPVEGTGDAAQPVPPPAVTGGTAPLVPSTIPTPEVPAPAVTMVAPSMSASPASSAVAPLPNKPRSGAKPRGADDPYSDAAAPRPVKTAAPSVTAAPAAPMSTAAPATTATSQRMFGSEP